MLATMFFASDFPRLFYVNNLNLSTHMCHIHFNYSCFLHNWALLTCVLNSTIWIAANLPGNHHNDSSSCSSGPESPNGPGDGSGRTQYVSATCVVVTHYSGDVANVVDEHFTRALNFNDKNSKGESSNFRPSWSNMKPFLRKLQACLIEPSSLLRRALVNSFSRRFLFEQLYYRYY